MSGESELDEQQLSCSLSRLTPNFIFAHGQYHQLRRVRLMEILSVFGRPQIEWESWHIQCMHMFNELIVLIFEISCTVQPVQLYSGVHVMCMK